MKKKILHVGCCNEPLPKIWNLEEWEEVRVDADKGDSTVHVAADTNRLPFANDVFDGVFASHLLEHFDCRERHQVFQEWKRVLKNGGFVYVVVPNITSKKVIEALQGGDPDRVLYTSTGGCPITTTQVIFGQYYPGKYEIHRWGYSPTSLCHFMSVYLKNITFIDQELQICAVGYK